MPLPINVFWPADQPVVAVADCLGADAAQVGAGPRFGPGDRGDLFARDHAREPAGLEVIGAVGQQVGEDHVIVQVERQADREVVALGEFFVQHCPESVVGHPHAAELFRHGQAQQALLAGSGPQFPGHHVVLVPLGVVGSDRARVELGGHLTEHLVVFFKQLALHCDSFQYRQQRPHRITGAAFGKGRTITAVLHEGERRGLNPRPPGPQPGALPTELRPPCAISGPPANRLAGKATTNSLPAVWGWFCHFCDFRRNFRETWRRLLFRATSPGVSWLAARRGCAGATPPGWARLLRRP